MKRETKRLKQRSAEHRFESNPFARTPALRQKHDRGRICTLVVNGECYRPTRNHTRNLACNRFELMCVIVASIENQHVIGASGHNKCAISDETEVTGVKPPSAQTRRREI